MFDSFSHPSDCACTSSGSTRDVMRCLGNGLMEFCRRGEQNGVNEDSPCSST